MIEDEHASAVPLVVLVLLLVFAGLLLDGDLPGPAGPHGTVGRVNGNILIRGLRKYHDSTGKYPDSLAQLVPKYMRAFSVDSFNARGIPTHRYQRDGTDFELSFRYPGIGLTRCSYRASDPTWVCRVGY